MKYLFYDCECANSYNKVSKICSLGYVLTDTSFNVIKKEDLLINPEDIFDYHLFSKNGRIHLAYQKKDFYNAPTFPERYESLKEMFENDNTLVLGFSLDNDVKFLADAAKRYNLDMYKFKYVDVQALFKVYKGMAENTSLDNAVGLEGIEIESETLHKSDDDAYLTMRVLKSILEHENLSLMSFLAKYNMSISSVDEYLQKVEARQKKKEDSKKKYLESMTRVRALNDLYDKASISPLSGKYSGHTYCFSNQVIAYSEEALKAQRIIYDNGGITTRNYSENVIMILGNKEKEDSLHESGIRTIWINNIIE